MNNKWKSSAFWLSVTAGVIVVLNSIGKAFNFNVNTVAITSVATSVIGLLVVIGVLTKTDKNISKTNQENNNETNYTQIEEKSQDDETITNETNNFKVANEQSLEEFVNILQSEIDDKIKDLTEESNNASQYITKNENTKADK